MTVCLLASYPRSGNTWLRALLTSCVYPDRPLVLDELIGPNVLVDAQLLARELGSDPHELTVDQLDETRSSWLRLQNAHHNAPERRFIKTHIVNRALPSGRRFADAECGQAIYIVRHPLDVAVSWAQFAAVAIDEVVTHMASTTAMIARPTGERPARLPELISGWSTHVDSWTASPALPTTIVRFEDLLTDPIGQLRCITDAIGIEHDDALLAHAVDACSFPQLQRLEQMQGFELSPPRGRFFRVGTSGQAARVPPKARAGVHQSAGPTLARYGYV